MSNTLKDFINKHRKKNIEDRQRREIKHNNKVAELQDRFFDNILERIEAFYGKYAGKDGITSGLARKKVSKYEYDRYINGLKQLKDSYHFTDIAKEEMNRNIVSNNVRRIDILSAEVTDELIVMTSQEEILHQEYMVEEVKKDYLIEILFIAGVASFLGRNKKKIDSYMQKEKKKIPGREKILRDVINKDFLSASWSERLWDNQDALRAELDRIIREGIKRGRNPKELAREIKKSFNSSKFNSERLLVTEMSRAQAMAQEDTYKRNNFDEYEFHAEPTACDVCSRLDGKIFKVKDMEIGTNMYPIHPLCHCSTSPHMSRESFEKDLERRGL